MSRLLSLLALYRFCRQSFGWQRAAALTMHRILRSALNSSYLSVARVTWQRIDEEANLRHPFLRSPVSKEEINWFRNRSDRVDHYRQVADKICTHSFETPAAGCVDWGWPPRWHQDVRNGYQWPVYPYPIYRKLPPPGHGVDIKIPWELARGYHLVALAQAWLLTRDERYVAKCFSYWESWVEENPAGEGIHWASTLEVAIRSLHWLWAFALLDEAPGWTPKRFCLLFDSLQLHGLHVEHNLEIGVRKGKIVAANHYLGGISALCCLGMLCPRFPQSSRWVEMGWKALRQEIHRQILPDGAHFESSTAYHCLALEMFLLPALVARREKRDVPAGYQQQLEKMLRTLPALIRPDRSTVRLGDDDNGRFFPTYGLSPGENRVDTLLAIGRIEFELDELPLARATCSDGVFWLRGRRGAEKCTTYLSTQESAVRTHHFHAVGWLVRQEKDHYLAFRTSAPQPFATTHAHSDLFSIELWLGGIPIIHDPGTGSYTGDPVLRNQLRSSRSHNVVIVDDYEILPFDPEDLFGLRFNGITSQVRGEELASGNLFIDIEHDAYDRLQDPVIHRRALSCQFGTPAVTVFDRLKGRAMHEATWCWNLHPDRELRNVEGGTSQAKVELDGACLEVAVEGGEFAGVEVISAVASPAYGQIVNSKRLEMRCRWQGELLVTTRFVPASSVAGDSAGSLR